jgi:hypothetical protein
MQAFQSTEEARELDLHNETFARLSELRAAAERARDLSELYRRRWSQPFPRTGWARWTT